MHAQMDEIQTLEAVTEEREEVVVTVRGDRRDSSDRGDREIVVTEETGR